MGHNIDKEELKELIREVVKEELGRDIYKGEFYTCPKKTTIDIQSVSVYACPIINEKSSNVRYTISTSSEDEQSNLFKD